jgi:hypothetical protein
MKVKIGHAVGDENGGGYNGKAGDQTGKEIRVQDWYNRKGGWGVVLECTDTAMADRAANFMERICNSPHYGYDRTDRKTGYTAIKNANMDVENAADSEFDCSSLCYACYIFAGLKLPRIGSTRSMEKDFLATGKFVAHKSDDWTNSPDKATRGCLYLTAGSHVAMVLTGVSAELPAIGPIAEPTRDLSLQSPMLRGEDVLMLQGILLSLGYDLGGTKADGVYGVRTDAAVRLFKQRAANLKADGIADADMRAMLGMEV